MTFYNIIKTINLISNKSCMMTQKFLCFEIKGSACSIVWKWLKVVVVVQFFLGVVLFAEMAGFAPFLPKLFAVWAYKINVALYNLCGLYDSI